MISSLSRRSFLTASLALPLLPALAQNVPLWDVIVIGAGAAGLSAAVAAAETGAKVLLIEKQPDIGGNTRISGGYFAAVDPVRQGKMGITDSIDNFYQQVLHSGGGHSDPVLARRLVTEAGPALSWLESYGMRFQNTVMELYGAHWPRCHKPLMPLGEGYVLTLSGAALHLGVEIWTNTAALDFIVAERKVVGVRARKNNQLINLLAKRGIVLACGGFGANREMIARFTPKLAGLTSDNTPGSTGEMLLAAQRIGAILTDMDAIQCLPGCPPGRTHRVRLHNDVDRFILVNHQGKRFIREDERRDVLRDAVLALPERYAYSLVDDDGLRCYNIVFQKEAVIGIETGDAWRGDSIGELARAMGLNAQNLEQTIAAYNAGVRVGHDTFGKAPNELKHEIRQPPFWACYAGMTIHYTMGGVRITPQAQVVDAQNRGIPGLFAAGEATGGIHGINRMGANGINDAIVFGRLAGFGAAQSKQIL